MLRGDTGSELTLQSVLRLADSLPWPQGRQSSYPGIRDCGVCVYQIARAHGRGKWDPVIVRHIYRCEYDLW
jgi:hypothetical protein